MAGVDADVEKGGRIGIEDDRRDKSEAAIEKKEGIK